MCVNKSINSSMSGLLLRWRSSIALLAIGHFNTGLPRQLASPGCLCGQYTHGIAAETYHHTMSHHRSPLRCYGACACSWWHSWAFALAQSCGLLGCWRPLIGEGSEKTTTCCCGEHLFKLELRFGRTEL